MAFSFKNVLNDILSKTKQSAIDGISNIDTEGLVETGKHLANSLKNTLGEIASQTTAVAKDQLSKIDKEKLIEQGRTIGTSVTNTVSELFTETAQQLNRRNDNIEVSSNLGVGKECNESYHFSDTNGTNFFSDEDKMLAMLQILDCAYENAISDFNGLGTAQEMAASYLAKNNRNVTSTINSLIKWQISAVSHEDFNSINIDECRTNILSLPTDLIRELVIQLRLISVISHLSGSHESSAETKSAIYLCLLGAEAGSVLSKVVDQISLKYTNSSLKNLSESDLEKINQIVASRLFTKFQSKKNLAINNLIPMIGGFIRVAFDSVSTYTIAQTAKTIFLQELLEYEKQEQIEIERLKVLVNMALVDGKYDIEEKKVLFALVSDASVSEKNKKLLLEIVESNQRNSINFSLIKSDKMLVACLIENLYDLVFADGKFSMAEKLYMQSLLKDLGYSYEELQNFMS